MLSTVLALALVTWATAGVTAAPERSVGVAESTGTQLTDTPEVTARATFVVDITAGGALWSDNADVPLPPASTTKIITALTARRVFAPDKWVMIEPSDLVDPAIYSNAGLQVGDRLRVRDLLAALLVASAGDAALALARVGGERVATGGETPQAAFVAAMNEEARRIGLRSSYFLTPDGRDVPGQVATARDLAIAAMHLLSDPLLADLVAAPSIEVEIDGPQARKVTLTNTNQLLTASDVIGVKTGTSPAAGQCLVAAVRRGHDIVVLVILGSQDRYRDAHVLLSWLDQHYRWLTLDGSTFPELAVLRRFRIVPALTPTVVVPADRAQEVELDVTYRPAAWGTVGTVRLRIGIVDLVAVPLVRVDQLGFVPISERA